MIVLFVPLHSLKEDICIALTDTRNWAETVKTTPHSGPFPQEAVL